MVASRGAAAAAAATEATDRRMCEMATMLEMSEEKERRKNSPSYGSHPPPSCWTRGNNVSERTKDGAKQKKGRFEGRVSAAGRKELVEA